MFLLRSYYVVIIILIMMIMMIQGQGQGPGAEARTRKKRRPRAGPPALFVGSWPWALAPPVHAQECCACTRVLRMHKNLVHAQESCDL